MLVLEIYEPNSDWLRILRHRNRFAARFCRCYFSGERNDRRKYVCVRRLAQLKDDAITYDVIVQRMREQLKLQRSALVARYKFDNRARNSGESVSHYVATLKHLATECKFGEAMRTERPRDPLVSGIPDSKMITELLKVKLADLSFDLAVQKCLDIEQASKDVQVLQREQVPILPVTFFRVSPLHDIYPRVICLLSGLLFPTCLLCVSHYATVIETFLNKWPLLRVMSSCATVTRFKLLTAIAPGTLRLLW